MTVLTGHNSVSALPGWYCSSYRLPRGALLVGAEVHRRYNLTSLCITPFLRWQLLYYVIDEVGRKRSWNRNMSWGWWFSASTIECIHWICISVSIGWPLWTPSSRWQLSALLNVRIISFSSCLINRSRGPAGLYVPIIPTKFSSRLIIFVSPYELKRFWIICSAVTCN